MPLPHPSKKRANAVDDPYDARESIAEFFSASPPVLSEAPNHTDSKSTRPPQAWDRHLDKNLILRRVVKAPSLVDDLKKLADVAVNSHPQLPCGRINFPTPAYRKAEIENYAPNPNAIRNEADVQNWYGSTTAVFCSQVASALYTQTNLWPKGHLVWHITEGNPKKPKEAQTGSPQSKASLMSKVAGKKRTGKSKEPAVKPKLPSMPKNIAKADGFLKVSSENTGQPGLRKIRDCFPVLAVWEFKNMRACNEGVMKAIQALADRPSFRWTSCELGRDCQKKHKAMPPTCSYSIDAENEEFPSIYAKRQGLKAQNNTDSQVPETEDKDAPENTDGPEGKTDKPDHIIQQAWSEGAKNDATFIIIHSGLWEIICYRDRETQTLYISDIIYLDGKHIAGYYKLHTGLFFAALLDAERRRVLLERNPGWKGITLQAGAPKQEIELRKLKPEEMIFQEAIFKRRWLVVEMAQPHWPTYSVCLDTYYLRRWTGGSSLATPDPANDTLIRLTVTNPFNQKRFTRATVTLADSPKQSLQVGVKVAEGATAVGLLRRAYEAYYCIFNHGGRRVPRIYGYFECTPVDLTRPFGILLMEDVGLSIQDHVVSAGGGTKLSDLQREGFVTALTELHAIGFTLPHLRVEHLMLSGNHTSTDTRIVGLGHAVFGLKERSDLLRDFKQLDHLLTSPRKRRVSNDIPSGFGIWLARKDDEEDTLNSYTKVKRACLAGGVTSVDNVD